MDIEWLKSKYLYDPTTGVFSNRKTGKLLGGINKYGYVRAFLKKKEYSLHRLAWFYMYGRMPKNIDHINHNRSDNRISNLREVDVAENQKNKSKYKNNTSGHHGVHWSKGKRRWVASISIDKQQKQLGVFADFSDAVDARKNAEILYGYHNNHGKD